MVIYINIRSQQLLFAEQFQHDVDIYIRSIHMYIYIIYEVFYYI